MAVFIFAVRCVWLCLGRGLAVLGSVCGPAQGERDLAFVEVYFENISDDLIAGVDDFARVFDEFITELRDVDEAVLVNADVHKCAEVGDVGDQPRTSQARRQVFEVVNVFAEGEGLKLFARVAARLFEFRDDVGKGIFTNFAAQLFGRS